MQRSPVERIIIGVRMLAAIAALCAVLAFIAARADAAASWAIVAASSAPSALRPSTFEIRIDTHGLPAGQYVLRFGRYVAAAQLCDRTFVRCGDRAAERALDVSLDGSGAPLWLRVVQRGVPDAASIELLPWRVGARDREAERSAVALFCGVFLAIGLSNLLIGLILRDRPLLVYSSVMLSAAASTAFQLPAVASAIVPGSNLVFQMVRESLFVAYVVSVVAFSRSFLDTRIRTPRLDRLLIALTSFVAVLELASGAIGPSALLTDAWDLEFFSEVLLFALVLFAAVKIWRGGFAPARFFTVGAAGHLLGNTAWYIAPLIGLGELNLSYGFQTGIAWEGIFLSVALADRIARANAERAAAQEREIDLQRRYASAAERFVPGEFLLALGRTGILDVQLGDHVVRTMTVMFADIRDFTSRSEVLQPGEVFAFVNAYLGRIAPILRAHGGFVDKYLGDGIMVLFPGDPRDAIAAALEAQDAVAAYSRDVVAQGHAPVSVGMGLHCGELVLGTVGESERLDTTVIADAVNLAARIEALTKTHGAPILCSESVAARLSGDDVYLRALGPVAIKGKRDPVPLFAVERAGSTIPAG
jgi:class 3 adenylate cyclase